MKRDDFEPTHRPGPTFGATRGSLRARRPGSRLTALAALGLAAFLPAGAESAPVEGGQGAATRGSGIQLTPDGKRTLISKDVGAERWAITQNEDDSVTGNVFFSDGRDPVFIFCEQTGETATDLMLRCESADRCDRAPCSADAWGSPVDVTLPRSFFEPPAPPPVPDRPLGRRRFSIDPTTSFGRSLSGLSAPVDLVGFEGFIDLEAGRPDPSTGIAVVDIVGASPVIAVEGFAPGVGPLAFCITPVAGQFPIRNAGVIDCDGGTDVGYDLVVDHNIGVVGVNGFTAADCTAAGGTVEDGSSPHPGVCNGTYSTSQRGDDSGPGALILTPNLIGEGGAFNVRITSESTLPCGDEGAPSFDVPITLTTGGVATTILDERNFPGSRLDSGIVTGENFSCVDWTDENGPGAVSFSGFALDYTLADFPDLPFDPITIYFFQD